MSDKLPEKVVRVAVLDWLNQNRTVFGRVIEAVVDELVPIIADQVREELVGPVEIDTPELIMLELVKALQAALQWMHPPMPMPLDASDHFCRLLVEDMKRALEAGQTYLQASAKACRRRPTSADQFEVQGGAQ